MSFSDFSSWPREQEQAFVVYEQRVTESQNKAWTIGGIVAGVAFVFALGVYFGVTPAHVDVSMDDTSSVTKKDGAKDAPAAEK